MLPHVLKRFAQSHPSVAVDVVIDQSSNLKRRLADRTLDMAILTCPGSSPPARRRNPADGTDRVGRRKGRLAPI